MALIKDKELDTGVTVNYWVPCVSIDGHSGTVLVLMRGYLDKAARDAGAKSMLREKVEIDMNKADFTWSGLYEAIKKSCTKEQPVQGGEDGETEEVETNFFVDAEDDL